MYSGREWSPVFQKSSGPTWDDSIVDASVASTEPQPETPTSDESPSLSILDDTLLACRHLGFDEKKVVPLAQRLIQENEIQSAEQLTHLVLKEL